MLKKLMEEGLLSPFSWFRFQLITYLHFVPDKIIRFNLLLTYIIEKSMWEDIPVTFHIR